MLLNCPTGIWHVGFAYVKSEAGKPEPCSPITAWEHGGFTLHVDIESQPPGGTPKSERFTFVKGKCRGASIDGKALMSKLKELDQLSTIPSQVRLLAKCYSELDEVLKATLRVDDRSLVTSNGPRYRIDIEVADLNLYPDKQLQKMTQRAFTLMTCRDLGRPARAR